MSARLRAPDRGACPTGRDDRRDAAWNLLQHLLQQSVRLAGDRQLTAAQRPVPHNLLRPERVASPPRPDRKPEIENGESRVYPQMKYSDCEQRRGSFTSFHVFTVSPRHNTKSKWIAAFEYVEAPSLRSTSTPKSLYSHLREPAGSEAASGDWKKRNGNKIQDVSCMTAPSRRAASASAELFVRSAPRSARIL